MIQNLSQTKISLYLITTQSIYLLRRYRIELKLKIYLDYRFQKFFAIAIVIIAKSLLLNTRNVITLYISTIESIYLTLIAFVYKLFSSLIIAQLVNIQDELSYINSLIKSISSLTFINTFNTSFVIIIYILELSSRVKEFKVN